MDNMLATLAFYASHKGYHTFNKKDRATRKAVANLVKEGYLEYAKGQDDMARFTGKTFISGSRMGD